MAKKTNRREFVQVAGLAASGLIAAAVGAAVLAFVPLIMRFHDFRELPALIRRQFAANFVQHFPEFLADLFADFVPH